MTVSPRGIRTPIRYAHPTDPAGYLVATAHARSTTSFVAHDTCVANARLVEADCTLDGPGFTLVSHKTAVTDFLDQHQVDNIYVPEIEALVARLTGASRVIVFHKLGRYEGGEAIGQRQPAGNAHIDYDEGSFRCWVRQELGEEEAERLLGKRWAAINVWRGITPVERRPLAFIDGRTVADDALLTVPILERVDKTTPYAGYNIKYDPAQAWYYYPDMQPDEALVFTLFDTDPDRTQRVAHSAIDDPISTPDAAPRASFEVRTIAFFD
jgi:hypothetical protein